MDVEERLELVKGIAEEIITEDELKELFQEKEHPVMYDGFEPSGLAHLPFGVYRALLLEDLMEAGIEVKLLLADWHAWLNNKMGGKLEDIQKAGEYFLEVWRAAGIDTDKIEIVWASELVEDKEYWERVLNVARNHTLNRAKRALTIMGRKDADSGPAARVYYPSMQVADIFELDVDICQLGMDQRRANMLAREVAPKLGEEKPVAVHHHMLMGLQKPDIEGGYDEDEDIDREISSKMSKSKEDTCIFVHDSKEEIENKLGNAYCPSGQEKANPVLDYAKEIVFRAFDEMKIERPDKYGGDVTYSSYNELRNDFVSGDLHPQDLKMGVAEKLNELIKPIREHFEEDDDARELYEEVKRIYEENRTVIY